MSDDLIARLRRGVGTAAGHAAQIDAYWALCREAANEIERLRRDADPEALTIAYMLGMEAGNDKRKR